MQHIPLDIEQQVERVMDFVGDIVAIYHQTQDFDESYLIVKDKLGDQLGMIFRDSKSSDMHRLLKNLMRIIWNHMPLSSNKYRPVPLPELRRNDKCWCGSGLKYKQCCLPDDQMPVPIDSTTIWSMLFPALTEEEIREAYSQRAIPLSVLVAGAVEDYDCGDYESARKKLEPVFEQNLDKAKDEIYFSVNLLCNIYDELGMKSEKINFLDKIKNTGSKPLRSEAWQRMATIYMDAGDSEAAWDAFHTARHLDHRNSGVDLLEVSLLMGEGDFQKAQERAKFILRRMHKNGTYEEDELTHHLESIASDPNKTYAEQYAGSDTNLSVLVDWLETVENRPLPAYHINEIPPFDEDRAMEQKEYTYEPPVNLQKVEKRWQKVFRGVDVFGVNVLPSEYSPWDNTEWLEFLQKHPECFDSLTILDDLTLAVKDYQPNDWILENILMPLGLRATQIYENFPVSGSFSWLLGENRPLIRSLFNFSETLHFSGEVAESLRLYEILLEANPNDNHGVRSMLINQYLVERNYEKIKKLLDKFPNDILMDIQMGRVLYLLQRGNQSEAKGYWHEIQARNPHIKRFMVSSSIAQPEAGQFGVAVGGKEEAWLYRQTMRLVWLKEKGAISWLKKN